MDEQYGLARIYDQGEEAERNIEQTIYWYTKAAEQGDSVSQYRLACHYCGLGDLIQAREWGQKAVENGHTIASICLQRIGIYHP